ncbi:MAG TPA: hypothetical protein PLK94_13165 [Alphaproteobacteria bacterium]|nr:hypothetical protein [Alphaproteobacteria bacterium]HOO52231.1 hypothetical protein [Alphaproteobacteria bacterium]
MDDRTLGKIFKGLLAFWMVVLTFYAGGNAIMEKSWSSFFRVFFIGAGLPVILGIGGKLLYERTSDYDEDKGFLRNVVNYKIQEIMVAGVLLLLFGLYSAIIAYIF